MFVRIVLMLTLCLAGYPASAGVREYEVCLFDSVRERAVPLAIYAPAKMDRCRGVVLFSHGYGANAAGSNKAYAYLTRNLAQCGDFVISVQHELPGDELLAMAEPFVQTRRSNWVRGVQNLLFVRSEGRRIWPSLPWERLILIGHSNGGDMTMLFATQHPELIRMALTLDHRRMPMPRTGRPRVATLRGCDYPADAGVLPDENEQQQYGIWVVPMPGIRHGDMDEKGSAAQHARICGQVRRIIRSESPVSKPRVVKFQ